VIISDRYSESGDISEAWLDALQIMVNAKARRAVHVTLRVADSTIDRPEIRALAQGLIDDYNIGKEERHKLWSVATTRNTIMPVSWARRNPEPADLATYYRDRYSELRKTSASKYGTYFGRLVAYPRDDKHANQYDQLSRVVDRLRREHGPRGTFKSSCYELSIYSERHDTNLISFPCLAHVSLHVHDGKLNMQAVYRNEYLVGRAYGNYWGLAELLNYIAAACPTLSPGELLLTLNHVELDDKVPQRRVKKVLEDSEPILAARRLQRPIP
jgi:thymidylate synthase